MYSISSGCTLVGVSDREPAVVVEGQDEVGRQDHVLGVALETFARYGYRKSSMEDVARAANISRPGLYFLFSSKQNLFRAAVRRALDHDIEAARRSLADTGRPLRERLIEALDLWTGRYIGPIAKEIPALIETNPELLGPIATDYPARFAEMVIDALAADLPPGRGVLAKDIARTLLSTTAGVKHEASTREEFVARITIGVDLLMSALDCSTRHAPPEGSNSGT
jgi:AcrR family transcriptional regulator